jgi:hypothetical protein
VAAPIIGTRHPPPRRASPSARGRSRRRTTGAGTGRRHRAREALAAHNARPRRCPRPHRVRRRLARAIRR